MAPASTMAGRDVAGAVHRGAVIDPPTITSLQNQVVATWGPGFAAGMAGAALTF